MPSAHAHFSLRHHLWYVRHLGIEAAPSVRVEFYHGNLPGMKLGDRSVLGADALYKKTEHDLA
jgi:hypothetical protein